MSLSVFYFILFIYLFCQINNKKVTFFSFDYRILLVLKITFAADFLPHLIIIGETFTCMKLYFRPAVEGGVLSLMTFVQKYFADIWISQEVEHNYFTKVRVYYS